MPSAASRKHGENPVDPPSTPEPLDASTSGTENFIYHNNTTSTEGATDSGDSPASVVDSPEQPAVGRAYAGRNVTHNVMTHDDAQASLRARRSAARALIAVNDRLGEPTPEAIRKFAAEENDEI